MCICQKKKPIQPQVPELSKQEQEIIKRTLQASQEIEKQTIEALKAKKNAIR
jgi:hypothetical protein